MRKILGGALLLLSCITISHATLPAGYLKTTDAEALILVHGDFDGDGLTEALGTFSDTQGPGLWFRDDNGTWDRWSPAPVDRITVGDFGTDPFNLTPDGIDDAEVAFRGAGTWLVFGAASGPAPPPAVTFGVLSPGTPSDYTIVFEHNQDAQNLTNFEVELASQDGSNIYLNNSYTPNQGGLLCGVATCNLYTPITLPTGLIRVRVRALITGPWAATDLLIQ